jgi:putative nucleoside-diphosphate sugar epimerase/dehydrase
MNKTNMEKVKYRYNRWRLALGRLVNLRYINRWIIFCADLFISLCVSLIGVLGLLSIMHVYISGISVLKVGIASFVASILSFLTFKVYHGVIRHSTLRGLWRIGGVAITKSILMFILLHLLRANFNSSIYWVGGITDCMLTIVLLITLRVFVINVYNSVLSQLGKKRKRVLVFGMDEDSVMIATSPNRQVFMQNYSIIGFLTFGSAKKNLRIAELPVYQIEDIDDLLRLIPRNNLDGILFPNIKTVRREGDRLIHYCEQASLKPLVVPDMEEVHEGGMKRSVREIRIEDLLGREEISINLGEIGLLLKDKTILVTGAAGSIGSEICRQLAHFPIKKLICLDAAVSYGVEKFVMISTDKAVNPTNIMGCSKRLAEIYVQSLSVAISKGALAGNTKFITTRFGNVLGSNGSVIPRFRDQIAKGGPVTVTHPDIIRYFMTIPEACRLVLEAGTMGKGGEIFIFDMGEPVKIADLAKRMIELSGLQVDKDIEIKYTGLRPGEKLYEELLSNKENTKETPHEKIRVAAVREYAYKDVVEHIDLLAELSLHVHILPMVREMKSFVPEFKSQNSQFTRLDGVN